MLPRTQRQSSPAAASSARVSSKPSRRKFTRYVRLGITPELDGILQQWPALADPHTMRLVLFEAASALVEARMLGLHPSPPSTKLEVAKGPSHWAEYWQLTHMLEKHERPATLTSGKEVRHG